jgi:hypothetical protein
MEINVLKFCKLDSDTMQYGVGPIGNPGLAYPDFIQGVYDGFVTHIPRWLQAVCHTRDPLPGNIDDMRDWITNCHYEMETINRNRLSGLIPNDICGENMRSAFLRNLESDLETLHVPLMFLFGINRPVDGTRDTTIFALTFAVIDLDSDPGKYIFNINGVCMAANQCPLYSFLFYKSMCDYIVEAANGTIREMVILLAALPRPVAGYLRAGFRSIALPRIDPAIRDFARDNLHNYNSNFTSYIARLQTKVEKERALVAEATAKGDTRLIRQPSNAAAPFAQHLADLELLDSLILSQSQPIEELLTQPIEGLLTQSIPIPQQIDELTQQANYLTQESQMSESQEQIAELTQQAAKLSQQVEKLQAVTPAQTQILSQEFHSSSTGVRPILADILTGITVTHSKVAPKAHSKMGNTPRPLSDEEIKEYVINRINSYKTDKINNVFSYMQRDKHIDRNNTTPLNTQEKRDAIIQVIERNYKVRNEYYIKLKRKEKKALGTIGGTAKKRTNNKTKTKTRKRTKKQTNKKSKQIKKTKPKTKKDT